MKPVSVPQSNQRAWGQYYTRGNPFTLQPFVAWAEKINLRKRRILEPFAGANHIIRALRRQGLCERYASFDIAPAATEVNIRDTIKSFPTEYEVCVTNPPWLARNSATRRGLPYPNCMYDNIYKHCLELCLNDCPYVAALIPASFLQSKLFQTRLQTYILLHEALFVDTDNPVCLALFGEQEPPDFEIYFDNDKIGSWNYLLTKLPQPKRESKIRFNDPAGQLGFISFDNTRGPSIRFCTIKEISSYPVKHSSRFFTRISCDIDVNTKFIAQANKLLKELRISTKDVFLTPFRPA